MNDDELQRMVLQAVADDYEELEMIISEIVKWTTADGSGTPDRRIEPVKFCRSL